MRLRTTKSAHSVSYSVIKSAYVNKKRTTVTVEILGNAKDICEKYGVDDAEAWARAHVAELNRKAREEESSLYISFSPARSIPIDEQRSFNVGFLFLQKIFYDLGLDKISKTIKKNRRFEYDLVSILSRLVYSRIIFPSSKKTTYELSRSFVDADSHVRRPAGPPFPAMQGHDFRPIIMGAAGRAKPRQRPILFRSSMSVRSVR